MAIPCVNSFTPQWTSPITPSWVLLHNNPLLRTMNNIVIGVQPLHKPWTWIAPYWLHLASIKPDIEFLFFSVADGDDCADHQCEDGATCVDELFEYSCICTDGKNGDRCQCKLTKLSIKKWHYWNLRLRFALHSSIRQKYLKLRCYDFSTLADWTPKQTMPCVLHAWWNKKVLTLS